MSEHEGPRLPSVEGDGPVVGGATLPPSDSPASPQTTPVEAVPRTRADRLRLTTASGGLTALPTGFDDADGDWALVQSSSYFERLYLDGAQFAAITDDTVRRNYTILADFWKERIAAMQTGAAKTQILLKYGGPHRSPELVLSYPRELKRAADRLLLPNGVASYHEELETARRERARIAIEPLLDVVLADDALEPAETRAFLAKAIDAGFTTAEAATLLFETIRTRQFQPNGMPSGETLDARLTSVSWFSPSRRAAVLAAEATTARQREPVPPPPGEFPAIVPPQPAPAFGPTTLIWTAVILLAGIILTWSLRQKGSTVLTSTAQTTSAVVQPTTTVVQTAATDSVSTVETTSIETPRVETTNTAAEALAEMQRRQHELAKQQQVEQQREEEERRQREAADAEILAALRSDVTSAMEQVRSLMQEEHYDAARELLRGTKDKAIRRADAFTNELPEIDRLIETVGNRIVRTKVLEGRLAELDALNADEKYPEAITIAHRLLDEPDLPHDISEHAQKSLTVAEEAMKKLVGGSDVKNVRTRRTRGRSF